MPDPLELAGVRVELCASRTTPGQHLANEHEPTRLQEQVVRIVGVSATPARASTVSTPNATRNPCVVPAAAERFADGWVV